MLLYEVSDGSMLIIVICISGWFTKPIISQTVSVPPTSSTVSGLGRLLIRDRNHSWRLARRRDASEFGSRLSANLKTMSVQPRSDHHKRMYLRLARREVRLVVGI